MWSQFLDQFSNHFILLGVAICVTLVAIWAGQSRLHWFLRGCVVAAVLALFLPVRAHEPLLFFLIAAPVVSLSVAWMESRRERTPLKRMPAGTDSNPKRSRQFSLSGAFLVLALVGMACGLGSAAFRGGLMMDWRSLPVSALTLATVALLSFRVGAFSQGMPHRWALAFSFLIGAGLLTWFALRGKNFSPIANATPAAQLAWWGAMVLACLVVFVVWYWELRFGSPRHFLALVGVVFVAPRIELDTLGDWMFVGDVLFPVYETGARTPGLIILTIAYGLLATVLVMFVTLGRLAFSTRGAAWQKHLARAATICGAAALLYFLGSLYWRLAWTMALPALTIAERGENPLEKALPLLDEFYSLEYPGRGFVPGDVPKGLERHQPGMPMAAIYAQLVEEMQKPGWAPMGDLRDASISKREMQILIVHKLLAFNSILDADAEQLMQRKNFDAALPYVMAQSQMEENLRRRGLMMHRGIGTLGWINMAALRSDVSTANARRVLAMLRRCERERESIDVTLQRERAWEERELNWRSRLRLLSNEDVPIASSGLSMRSYYPLKKFRELDQVRPAYPRLLATEIALRLFREDHGRLPQTLDELVPTYLDSVPLDPWSTTGQPLVYRTRGDKYSLYTIWSNGRDDGGVMGKGDYLELRDKLPVDFDVDTAVRALVQAKVDAKAKAAQDARVRASMLKAQMGGRTPTPPPQGGE